jgi:hypothetical protein
LEIIPISQAQMTTRYEIAALTDRTQGRFAITRYLNPAVRFPDAGAGDIFGWIEMCNKMEAYENAPYNKRRESDSGHRRQFPFWIGQCNTK